VLQTLATSEQGLSSSRSRNGLPSTGPNRLGEEDRISKIRILAGQFTSPLIYILLIAAGGDALLRGVRRTRASS